MKLLRIENENKQLIRKYEIIFCFIYVLSIVVTGYSAYYIHFFTVGSLWAKLFYILSVAFGLITYLHSCSLVILFYLQFLFKFKALNTFFRFVQNIIFYIVNKILIKKNHFHWHSAIFLPSKKSVAGYSSDLIFQIASIHDKICRLLNRLNNYAAIGVCLRINGAVFWMRMLNFFHFGILAGVWTCDDTHFVGYLPWNHLCKFHWKQFVDAAHFDHIPRIWFVNLFTQNYSSQEHCTVWFGGD